MPIVTMALLALMIIGAIGMLPATAAILELLVHAQAAIGNAADPMTTAVATAVVSGAGNSLASIPRQIA
jgi:uncharacterized SAM-binding protein YcdF (DUF218 family)